MWPSLFLLGAINSRAMRRAAFAKQSWETASASWECAPVGGDPNDSSAGESDDEKVEGEDAGAELTNMLMSLVWKGELAAKTASTIAFWAAQAGAVGVGDIGLKPSSPTGHFQRKLDRYCGIDVKSHQYYLVDTPSHSRFDRSRHVHALPMNLPHELVERELKERPTLHEELDAAIASGRLPDSYFEHKVVKDNPTERVLPLGLFIDGVQHTKRRSLLAIYVFSVITEQRYSVAVLKMSYAIAEAAVGVRCDKH